MVGLENADSPQEVLYVHQALLDEQCHPLCDELREFWKVFDFETVQRFALFLYDGDYSYPTPAPVGVVMPARSGSNKPGRLLESGTFSLSPQSGANSTNSTTPGAGGPEIGGSSNSSTLFDAARASTAPENAPETMAKLGQLLRDGPFGSTKPASEAPTAAARTTGGLPEITSLGTTGDFEDTTKTEAKPTAAFNTLSAPNGAVSGTTNPAFGDPRTRTAETAGWLFGAASLGTAGASEDTKKPETKIAAPSNKSSMFGRAVSEIIIPTSGPFTTATGATGVLFRTFNPGIKPGLFRTNNSGTAQGLPGNSRPGERKKKGPRGTGTLGKTGKHLGTASPGITGGLLGIASSRSSWATIIGTICPRPMFFPCKLEEGEDSQNIAAMPEYRGWSLEELRVQDYLVLGKLYSTRPGRVSVGQTSAPARPLTPLESFEIRNLHRITETPPPERLEYPIVYDFEAVLLAHARLYILSRSQGVSALSDLCISRLWGELVELSAPEAKSRISDNVVKLLRYVYCSPREMATPEALQPAWRQLQDLSSQFCALNIHLMGTEPGFRTLLQEAGALATDIMDKTLRRLMSVESSPPSGYHPAAQGALSDWDGLAARDAAIRDFFRKPEDPTPVGPVFGQTPATN